MSREPGPTPMAQDARTRQSCSPGSSSSGDPECPVGVMASCPVETTPTGCNGLSRRTFAVTTKAAPSAAPAVPAVPAVPPCRPG